MLSVGQSGTVARGSAPSGESRSPRNNLRLALLAGAVLIAMAYFNWRIVRGVMPSLAQFLGGTNTIELLDLVLFMATLVVEVVFLVLVLGGLSTFVAVRNEYGEARRLREQTEEWIRSQQEAKNELDLRTHALDIQGRYVQAVALAFSTLSGPLLPEVCRDEIREISHILRGKPHDRRLTIVLARLYEEGLKDRSTAIGILTHYILEKPAGEDDPHGEVADIYYNRAWYFAKDWQSASLEQHETLKKKISADLKQSFSIRAARAEDALVDPDFDGIKAETWFAELCGQG